MPVNLAPAELPKVRMKNACSSSERMTNCASEGCSLARAPERGGRRMSLLLKGLGLAGRQGFEPR